MLIINGLTNDAMQQLTLDGIPGVEINVTLRFMPRIQIWNMDVAYGSFLAQGIPVLCSPNLLRQWRNIIPFGIACSNIYQLDPYTIIDFVNGNSTFYLLDGDDVASIEQTIYGDGNFTSLSTG